MPRGGKRPGAGRPPGSPNVRTREAAQRAAAEGVSPVQAMLGIMRNALARGDEATALDAASRAAPYCHPRLSAVAFRDDARERMLATLANPQLDAFLREQILEALRSDGGGEGGRVATVTQYRPPANGCDSASARERICERLDAMRTVEGEAPATGLDAI